MARGQFNIMTMTWSVASFRQTAWRFIAWCVLLGALASQFSAQLALVVLPIFEAELRWIDDPYRVEALSVVANAGEEVFSADVGIARDFELGGDHIVADPRARATASTLVRYMALSSVILIAFVLAWPALGSPVWKTRGVGLVGALLALWCLDTPITLLAAVWKIHVDLHEPGGFSALLLWAGFLQGGGRIVLPVALGLLVVHIENFNSLSEPVHYLIP